MKRNSPYLQTLRAFIRRVTEILLRRGITARATIVEVLRRLRQRGIWPAKNQVQKESTDTSSPMRELSEQAQAFLATYDVVDAATEGSAALSADAASPAWLTATDIYTSNAIPNVCSRAHPRSLAAS